MKRLLIVLGCCVITTACEGANPMAPSPVTTGNPLPPVSAPPPGPPVAFLQPFTELQVGSTLGRTVLSDANPDCPGLPGWGCQFFRVTPMADGLLTVAVDWEVETQPHQGLDLSIEYADGNSHWADMPYPGVLDVQGRVQAGRTDQITVWYTFPGVTFELTTSMDTP